MIKREAIRANPRGGILADDQGLGKTITTLGLIISNSKNKLLMEPMEDIKTLNKLLTCSPYQTGSLALTKDLRTYSKYPRKFGGTLIICPTTILNQWVLEFQSKLNSKNGIKISVYYGSQRNSNVLLLLIFDVVLTTYQILVIEAPKTIAENNQGNIDRSYQSYLNLQKNT
jgi:SNF2 family DNA or RNA helicase